VGTIAYGMVLLGFAGTVAWPAAWAYLAVMSVIMTAYARVMARVPELVAERKKPPKDAKRWDRPLVVIIGIIGPFGLIVIAGLDHRLRWSEMAPWWQVLGALLVVAGGTLTHRAVAANRFFSAVIRIQTDRGHQVVDAGPYRFVRHPGYLGSLIHMPGAALMLGSWWGLLFVAVIEVVMVVRTAWEDRTLQSELGGYADYARRVKYRLIPRVW